MAMMLRASVGLLAISLVACSSREAVAPDGAAGNAGSGLVSDAGGDGDATPNRSPVDDATDDTMTDTPPGPDGGPDAACVVVATLDPVATASVATGTIVGPNLKGTLCAGDTFAYAETAATVPFLMVINGGDAPGDWHFESPANATHGGITSYFGIDQPKPGTYSSATGTCGSLSFCVGLPIPASLDCGNGHGNCPPGCGLAGPAFDVRCTPVEPETCYVAQSASNCLGSQMSSQTPRGTWTLTLTSVGPFVQLDGGTSNEGRFATHGTLTATMEGDGPDAGASTATLNLTF